MTHEWTDEELNELHDNLYAFLSFMDADTLEIMGRREPIVVGHVRALKRALEMQINDHGGRFYKQATIVTNGSLKK